MIDLEYYLSMIRHKQRVTLFQDAIDTCVSSNDVVVEIGTGLGTYSFFAVKSGARRVYAIEENDIIRVARELARKNKLSERITFVQGDSTEVVLKEKGDVLIFEDFSSRLEASLLAAPVPVPLI